MRGQSENEMRNAKSGSTIWPVSNKSPKKKENIKRLNENTWILADPISIKIEISTLRISLYWDPVREKGMSEKLIIIGEILLCTPLCSRTAATSMSWNMISSAANLSILLGVFGVPGVQVTRIECVPAQAVCLSVCPPVCLSVCLSVCPSVCPSLYFAMSYKNDCGVYYGVYHCVKSGGRTGNFSIPFLNLSCSLTELISVDYHGEVYSHQVNIQPGNVTLSCLGYFLENGVFGVREVSCKYNSNTETRCVYQDKTFKTYWSSHSLSALRKIIQETNLFIYFYFLVK